MTSLPLLRPLALCAIDPGEPPRKVSWLELFHDLIFVASVSQVASPLSQDLSAASVVRFSLFLVLVWWAWLGHTMFATRFETGDLLQRALTLLQMFLVAVMGINAGHALDSRESAGMAAAYAVLRLVLAGQYWRASRIPESRALTVRYFSGCLAAAVLWLASAFVPAPARFGLWGLALAIDVSTPLVAERVGARVPPDPSHLPERFGLFTLILLGESILAVVQGMRTQETWSLGAATAAFAGLSALFLVWWAYFDGVEGAGERHVRTPGDAMRLRVWSYAHLPLYIGVVLMGVGFEHLIDRAAVADVHAGELVLIAGATAAVSASLGAMAGAREAAKPAVGSNI